LLLGLEAAGPEVLQIGSGGNRVGVGAEWRSAAVRLPAVEVKGLTLISSKKVFTALLAGEEIVDRSNEGVAAEFEGVVAGIEAEGFGELGRCSRWREGVDRSVRCHR